MLPGRFRLSLSVTELVDDELLHEFDGVINLYDSPGRVHHKLRQALEQTRTTAQPEGYELSEREREILVAAPGPD